MATCSSRPLQKTLETSFFRMLVAVKKDGSGQIRDLAQHSTSAAQAPLQTSVSWVMAPSSLEITSRWKVAYNFTVEDVCMFTAKKSSTSSTRLGLSSARSGAATAT